VRMSDYYPEPTDHYDRPELDKLARLHYIENLLLQNSQGYTIRQIAQRCNVSTKQARRDMDLLSQSRIPVWENDGRFGILTDQYRPSIVLNPNEAMIIFIAARLLMKYSYAQNPTIESALRILSSTVPAHLRDQINKTVDWMHTQKINPRYVNTLNAVGQSWMEGHQLKIWYWTLGKKPEERIIEPYFIQPELWEHGNYVIAYCHTAKEIRIFKIERIKSYELLNTTYKVPKSFDINKYLENTWGITAYGEVETVKLKFTDKNLVRIAQETIWHPTQTVEKQPDGSVIVTFKLHITPDFEGFVRSWGEEVEVVEPKSLRKKIGKMGR
jgi:predicted DNA-binding transcriptional regulator YafY